MTIHDEIFLRRCFDLARLGTGYVSPNPMVGAVLVYQGRIIGEGWHQRWGEAHAEVNCIRSVKPEERDLISKSTLYCSLEPCFHVGKTPPCVDLILENRIPRVVISNVDPNPKVAGQSIVQLRAAGVEVVAGVLEAEGRQLNRPFFTWITAQRPYVVLKWAQSTDGYLSRTEERTAISGPAAQRLVHRWRSESDAILVGNKTALTDNPRLDARLYFGKNPLRVVFDAHGKIPPGHHLRDGSIPTWVLDGPIHIPDLLQRLAADRRAILLVEGGAHVLHQFLDGGWWDEIRVIENTRLRLGGGVAAPVLPTTAQLVLKQVLNDDWIRIFEQGVPAEVSALF